MFHKDVEFHVAIAGGSWEATIHKTFAKAAEEAFEKAITNGRPVWVDVVIFSEAGALAWGGDSAVERYNEDEAASVFERLVMRVDSQGRIP